MLLETDLKRRLLHNIRQGLSINKISQELGVGKSTIYYHYKKIKGRKYKLLNIKKGYSRIEGEIVGIFTGDGSQYYCKNKGSYRTHIHFGNEHMDYACYVQRLYSDYFGKEFRLHKQTPWGVRLATTSKQIFDYFYSYLNFNPHIKHCTVQLRDLDVPSEFLIGFLKGLLDTDGSIFFDGKGLKLNYTTTSKRLAYQIKEIGEKLGIRISVYHLAVRPRHEKPCYALYIWKKSTDSFLRLAKPFKLNTFSGR